MAVRCFGAASNHPKLFDAELVNLSRSGMFLASAQLVEPGAEVEFEFNLDDGVVALRGKAEVVRRVEAGRAVVAGMGLRFVALDEPAQELLARLVDDSLAVPEIILGTESGAFPSGGIVFHHGSIRVVLSPETARCFTRNPLLHIGVGGCFLPADADVPLGTGYQLDIVDGEGRTLLRCKALVAAKQARQIGLRLVDVDRATLQVLREQITKLAPAR